MSNRHLLPNLTDQHQQRQLRAYIQGVEASLKNLPGSNPLLAAEYQLQELANCTNELNNTLKLVGHVSPFLDVNFLTTEGKTNVAALDQHYLAVIGQQLIKDYYSYRDTASKLSARIKNLFILFDQVKLSPTDENLAGVLAEATFIHGEYVEWVESFLRTIGAATRDIINHLNLYRNPIDTIPYPFPDHTEVVIA
jgi:hypothetical protein